MRFSDPKPFLKQAVNILQFWGVGLTWKQRFQKVPLWIVFSKVCILVSENTIERQKCNNTFVVHPKTIDVYTGSNFLLWGSSAHPAVLTVMLPCMHSTKFKILFIQVIRYQGQNRAPSNHCKHTVNKQNVKLNVKLNAYWNLFTFIK